MLLLLTAAIWGAAFVAQSVGMEYIGPFTFNFVRNIIGGVVLIPCIGILKRIKKDKSEKNNSTDGKILLSGGICCGIALFLASSCQQIGIQYTSVGKAGFITALYIVIVPIMGIFLKKKCSLMMWVSVIVALAGFYLLSVKDGFRLEKSDTLLLASAVLFSVHILIIDYFSPKVDGVKMACIQFFVCGILSAAMMMITEKFVIADVIAAWKPVLYAGVLSCGVAYTLQIVGQKGVNPTVASLLLSLESVFAVVAGWIVLRQGLSEREIVGCVLIFVGIVGAQVPWKRKEKR